MVLVLAYPPDSGSYSSKVKSTAEAINKLLFPIDNSSTSTTSILKKTTRQKEKSVWLMIIYPLYLP